MEETGGLVMRRLDALTMLTRLAIDLVMFAQYNLF